MPDAFFLFLRSMFPPQGLFSGEIMRDLLIFMPKISLKFAKWEKKSHTKMKIPQKILQNFLTENQTFLPVLAE